MKNAETIFRLGMTAAEVVLKIVEVNPEISSLLFEVYTAKTTLEEETALRTHASLSRMIRHEHEEEIIWLERKEITLERIQEITDGLAEKRALAAASVAKLLDAEDAFHIPMMDFESGASPENLEEIQKFLRKIGQRGAVLLSGRSYHYYGVELLREKDWFVFLGKCLLFVDFVDSRYVGHRLIDSYAALRLSTSMKHPHQPIVVAIV